MVSALHKNIVHQENFLWDYIVNNCFLKKDKVRRGTVKIDGINYD